MLVFLPLFVLILLILIFYQKGYELRVSILLGAIFWGVILTFVIELLSMLKILDFSWILTVWMVTLFILFSYYFYIPKRRVPILNCINNIKKISLYNQLLLFMIFVIVSSIFIIAIVAPPNNGDSLTYHMSRIMHWQQNRSVFHYPTSNQRQLFLNPWAEFAIMNFQILSSGDHYANLIQWLSMVGSIIGVTLIAKRLGANIKAQIITAVITVTTPMGILQGSSTQNDYVLSFWLICVVNFILQLSQKEKIRSLFFYSLIIGCSLGLAILTKGTAYIVSAPFIIWLSLVLIRKYRESFIKIALLMLSVILLLNIGHYFRNINLYGSPLGSTQEGGPSYKFSNDIFTVPAFISNVVRNLCLHLDSPLYKVNLFIERQVIQFHKTMGIGINDSRTTWGGGDINAQKFHIPYLSTNEDVAGNPIHLFLIVIALVFTFSRSEFRRNKNLIAYALALLFSFLLFCLILRWQYWNSRLHLPMFILYTPFVAIILSKVLNKIFINLIVAFLTVFSFYWVLFNTSRPVIGDKSIFITNRIDQYFINDAELLNGYKEAANYIKKSNCSQIGLKLYSAEYPLWVLLSDGKNNDFRMEHVSISNISKRLETNYPYNIFSPCVVISVGVERNMEFYVKDKIYFKIWTKGPVSLFIRKSYEI